jgi:hypothetical protein
MVFTAVSIAVEYLELCCLLLGEVDDLFGEVYQFRYMYSEALVTHPWSHVIEKGQSLIRHLSSHMTVGYRGNLIGELRQFVKVCGK